MKKKVILRRKKERKAKNNEREEFILSKVKFFYVFIIIVLIFFFENKIKSKDINNNDENNNDWIKGNKTEILEKYISNFKGNFGREVLLDIERLKELFNLKIFLKKENSHLNIELKNNLIEKLSQKFNKNISFVENIFVKEICFFGNRMIALNNIIYYSEILGIKNIYLNSEYDWYIKNDIITDKIKISITSSSNINCDSKDTICGHIFFDFFFPVLILPERRYLILKEEIKRNLPKIEIKKDDLYIYIRGGDVFTKAGPSYAPPPYCFYKKILDSTKFNDIYIISIDKSSPIVGKLMTEYPKIIHNKNSVEIDISILSNAYNLVSQVSSFVQICIGWNDNLVNLWDCDTHKLSDKIYFLHYDLYKIDRVFNVYRMKPDEEYFYQKMINWISSDEQKKLLIEAKCKYDLVKTVYKGISFP